MSTRHMVAALAIVLLAVLAISTFISPSAPSALAQDRAEAWTARQLKESARKLSPLHEAMKPSGPMDWLSHHRESGQTFRQYLKCRPVTPKGARRIIYIQPLGGFTAGQNKVVDRTAEFMALFYNVPVVTKDALPLSIIPSKARRTHPAAGMKQILTSYVLHDVLRPRLPKDAVAYIAFTASDLWPGEGWNFVFGQASLRNRVGVWSIHRNGNPDASEEDFRLCLWRTMQTGVHEMGHMCSMRHCIRYECGMCGSNHREESDRRPLWFCPECMPKVCWATGTSPVDRYKRLADFCGGNGLTKEREFYLRSVAALQR